MILAALLLQAAVPQTAVDAERAFNQAAQEKGQWTAFRAFATDDAVMFVPQPTNAQAWLKDRKDPPQSVEWWPTESYVSCDGNLAVNTGGWKRPDGSVGYFTTVWKRQADGRFKWQVDGGDTLSAPLPKPQHPKIVRPDCTTKSPMHVFQALPDSDAGTTRDLSLIWQWTVAENGARRFTVTQWDGKQHRQVLVQSVAPSK